jgi:hypothetical protein
MIKKLLISGILLATGFAGYGGASWWAGFRIQSQSYAAVDALNLHLSRSWSDQVRLSARAYQQIGRAHV